MKWFLSLFRRCECHERWRCPGLTLEEKKVLRNLLAYQVGQKVRFKTFEDQGKSPIQARCREIQDKVLKAWKGPMKNMKIGSHNWAVNAELLSDIQALHDLVLLFLPLVPAHTRVHGEMIALGRETEDEDEKDPDEPEPCPIGEATKLPIAKPSS